MEVLGAQAAKTRSPDPQASTPTSGDQELDEILVEGRKPLKSPTKAREWMMRLPGRFVVDGSAVLNREGVTSETVAVQGRTNCVSYPTPAVLCELKLRWSEPLDAERARLFGGASKLDPAVLMYTYDVERVRVRHMLVDSEGIAESAVGFLYDSDTLITRNKCVNVPGDCQRTVQVTAEPDLRQVEMKIDMEVEFLRVATFRLVMHRVPGAPPAMDPVDAK
jgi:hypothetical protein